MRNLILSGGTHHPYEVTSAMLADILKEVDIESEITEDFSILADPRLNEFDVITMNCACYTYVISPGWEEWVFEITSEMEKGLLNFLRAGKGLMALHAATICFDNWPEFQQILGGYWDREKSAHGPLQAGYRMHIVDRCHPITKGIEDFEIFDELYHTQTIVRQVHTLMTALWEGKLQPMAWVTSYEKARVYYNALGHDEKAFECKPYQKMLQQGIEWVAG